MFTAVSNGTLKQNNVSLYLYGVLPTIILIIIIGICIAIYAHINIQKYLSSNKDTKDTNNKAYLTHKANSEISLIVIVGFSTIGIGAGVLVLLTQTI